MPVRVYLKLVFFGFLFFFFVICQQFVSKIFPRFKSSQKKELLKVGLP